MVTETGGKPPERQGHLNAHRHNTHRPQSMTDTTTRPGEISRIAQSDYEFRIFMITSVTEIKTTLQSHQEEDSRRFDEINSRLGNVYSSVGNSEKQFSRYDGMKSGMAIAAAFFLSVGSAIWAIFTYFTGKH